MMSKEYQAPSGAEHPITPPPELRRLWAQQAQRMDPKDPIAWQEHIATQAARWGADQELEACCEWLVNGWWFCYEHEAVQDLRAARRPKPPTLKEQALKALLEVDGADHPVPVLVLPIEDAVVIRRALEQLDD
jgi:hypothetical protein